MVCELSLSISAIDCKTHCPLCAKDPLKNSAVINKKHSLFLIVIGATSCQETLHLALFLLRQNIIYHKMSDSGASRFKPQIKTTNERLSTHTVGLVALSDFRKRRAEVIEQQERESREAAYSGTSTPDVSQAGTPDNAGSDSGNGTRPLKKKKKKQGKKLLSFDDEEGEDEEPAIKPKSKPRKASADETEGSEGEFKTKFKANASVGMVPKAMTKSALRKEAAERDALRREFLAIQEAVKATEIALPFVFYDGSNIPGGIVRLKKGDFIWVFLDKSRKVGADLGVGEKSNARREWARVGVDDLMLVRGTVIIPHVSFSHQLQVLEQFLIII